MQMKEVEGREGTSGGTDFFFPSLSLELRLSLPMDRSFEGKELLERSGGEAQTRKEGRGGEAKVTEGSEERGIKKSDGSSKKKNRPPLLSLTSLLLSLLLLLPLRLCFFSFLLAFHLFVSSHLFLAMNSGRDKEVRERKRERE